MKPREQIYVKGYRLSAGADVHEAVEAAAKVLADCIGTGANNWEWHVDDARALLEAAAPYMTAERGEWRKGESGWE